MLRYNLAGGQMNDQHDVLGGPYRMRLYYYYYCCCTAEIRRKACGLVKREFTHRSRVGQMWEPRLPHTTTELDGGESDEAVLLLLLLLLYSRNSEESLWTCKTRIHSSFKSWADVRTAVAAHDDRAGRRRGVDVPMAVRGVRVEDWIVKVQFHWWDQNQRHYLVAV